MKVRFAHTPDADDAFMFYAMVEGKVSESGIEPEFVVEDIESLNRKGETAESDVSAFSFHAYAYLADKYDIMNSGSSMGDGYGPVVVAKRKMTMVEVKKALIAIPGEMTSSYLAARLALGEFKHKTVRFDRIIDAVTSGKVDAGILIHEGQITYAEHGLEKILDLGEWWCKRTGLPLPLGCDMINRSLPEDAKRKASNLLGRSIEYALAHRDEALDHAMKYARGMERAQCDRFVSMYVNELTRDLGERGRRAVAQFLKIGYDEKVVPKLVRPIFV
jgi:1,4-dihydroxy-6-naphthoate synthase